MLQSTLVPGSGSTVTDGDGGGDGSIFCNFHRKYILFCTNKIWRRFLRSIGAPEWSKYRSVGSLNKLRWVHERESKGFQVEDITRLSKKLITIEVRVTSPFFFSLRTGIILKVSEHPGTWHIFSEKFKIMNWSEKFSRDMFESISWIRPSCASHYWSTAEPLPDWNCDWWPIHG